VQMRGLAHVITANNAGLIPSCSYVSLVVTRFFETTRDTKDTKENWSH
jgi:hypothetical protein